MSIFGFDAAGYAKARAACDTKLRPADADAGAEAGAPAGSCTDSQVGDDFVDPMQLFAPLDLSGRVRLAPVLPADSGPG